MCQFLNETEVWDNVISYTESNPLDFLTLESHYQIGKLELGKLISIEIRAKQKEFQLRYSKQSEQTSKTWMENQFRLFMWFVFAFFKMIEKQPQNFESKDWQLVAKAFKKQPNVCKYFYLCSIKAKTQTWNQEQDDIIQTLMKTSINKKWTDIGLQLFKLSNGKSFRKPKAIRERWLSHLNPSIKKQMYSYPRSEWSLEEELDLIGKIKEFGKKWSKIAKVLGNRSEHIVKNRFNKIKQKYEKQIEKMNKRNKFSESEFIEFLESQFQKNLLLKDEKQENQRKLLNGSQQTIFISTEEMKLQAEPTEVNLHQAQLFEPIILIFPCLSL